MEDSITLVEIVNILRKRWILIISVTIAAVLSTAFISYYVMKPVYQASTQLLVNQKNTKNQLDITLLRSNVDLINTYTAIIKSPVILKKVINELDLKQNADQLNQTITINSQEDSQVFTLTVENSDPAMAVNIANTVSEVFQDNIKGIMNIDNVNILAMAELKDHPVPVKPNPILNISIALVVGVIAGIGITFLLEVFNNTIKNGQDVIKSLGLPVLGTIQKIPGSQMRSRKNKIKKIGSEKVVSNIQK